MHIYSYIPAGDGNTAGLLFKGEVIGWGDGEIDTYI
jgi:hypothetical protein